MTKAQEDKLRESTFFYVLGYELWLNWEEMEPDAFELVRTYNDEGKELFGLLAARDFLGAVVCLREGPWSAKDLGQLLPELDSWAMALSEKRRALGEMSEDTLQMIRVYGMEQYHLALLEKHKESAEATEALQAKLEAIGLELLDTGAMYSASGEQEGPRDLVMGVPGTETEYAFRVWHAPRKAETDDNLPKDVEAAVRQWEVVA